MYQINPFWGLADVLRSPSVGGIQVAGAAPNVDVTRLMTPGAGSIVASGLKPNDVGTLVVELLFEDGAGSGTAANTGTLGGTFTIGGSLNPSIVATGGHDGGGYLQFQDAGTSDNNGCASDGHPPQLIIGTANFEISVYAQFVRYDTAWGQAFWGWEFGNPSPRLFCEDVTGKLRIVDGTVNIDTGFTCPIDSTWRKYTLRRLAGVIYALVDGVVQYSGAYTSNCNVGFNNGSFRVGADGNAAGGQCGKFDDFRFYNANV